MIKREIFHTVGESGRGKKGTPQSSESNRFPRNNSESNRNTCKDTQDIHLPILPRYLGNIDVIVV